MGIINKKSIRNTLENPFSFVLIFLLIILALANSFAIGCLISALIGTIISLISLNQLSPTFFIELICKDSSWKLKSINLLTNILGRHIIFIIILGLIVWVLLNHTRKGQELLSFLD